MKRSPVVSVLMPVYNAERYVAEAVESILAQTFPDFEFLISDNASTDRTLSMLERYAAKDPRIKLIRRQARSIVESLNPLIARSQGEFLARMDGDDAAVTGRFSDQVAFLKEHPAVVCVGSSVVMIDSAGCRLETVRHPVDDQEIQEEALRGISLLAHPTVMMRRNAVVSVGGYDVRWDHAENNDFRLRLGEIGERANIATVGLKYGVHEKLKTYENAERLGECVRAIVEEAYVRRVIHFKYVAQRFDRLRVGRRARHDHAAPRSYRASKDGERRTSLLYGFLAIWLAPWRLLGWKMVTREVLGI